MPRNSSGVFSLAQAAFVPNTVISSAAVNSDLSDIATALTGSLPVNGSTGMTGQFLSTSGNVGAPGLSFASDTNTGFYLAGTHQIGWASNGAIGATFNNGGSVTWQGAASWAGGVTFNGTSTLNGNVTLNATTYTISASAANAFYSGLNGNLDVALIIDGGGSTITTGAKGQIHIPFSITISSWRIMADQVGSITIDVRRTHNGVPVTSMVGGGGNTPTLAGTQLSQVGLAGWTSSTLVADDWIDFNVTSATTVQRVTIVLSCTRTSAI